MVGEKSKDELRSEITSAVNGSHGFTRLQAETVTKVYYAIEGGEPTSPIFVDEIHELNDTARREKVAEAACFEYDAETPRPFNREELEQIHSLVVACE